MAQPARLSDEATPRIGSASDSVVQISGFDPAGDLRRSIESAFAPNAATAPGFAEEARGWSPRARISFLMGAAALCWSGIALAISAIL